MQSFNLKKVTLITFISISVILIVWFKIHKSNLPQIPETPAPTYTPPVTTTPVEDRPETWLYDSVVDQMTSKITRLAYLTSDTQLKLSSPYSGFNQAHLKIRKKSKELDAYITIDKGQILGTYSQPSIRIRFDDEPAKYYSVDEAASGSSDIIFIEDARSIVNKLKTADKTLIEIMFFNDGTRILEFNTQGFQWPY